MEKFFEFGAFQLDQERRLLLKEGLPVGLGGRAFDLLVELVVRAGEVVAKDDLMHRIWPNTHVDETNLRVHIAAVRKVLGEASPGSGFIETVAGRGYCFVSPVVLREQGRTDRGAAVNLARAGLPAPLTRAIGREQVIDQVASDLQVRRSITIVGPGGLGKTTVAWAVARQLVASYKDGVCFLDLAPLNEQRLVASAFAARLGVTAGPEDFLPAILTDLRDKSMLVVLDNCEHVIDSVATLAENVLKGAPGVHLLATSREPLRMAGESLHRLPALAVPPHSAQLTAAEAVTFAAVELFIERATATLDTFELRDNNVNIICDICRRLDGIPLAIELAAPLVNLLGLAEFSQRLSDYFSILIKGRRTALPRHQTLRATLDWSHNLLSLREQTILRRVAAMAGAFSAEAAMAVASDPAIEPPLVLGLIADLVDKSLIGTDVSGATIRYRLLQTTRAYAAEKLHLSDDDNATSRRHALYFLAHMRQAAEEWKTLDRAGWMGIYAVSIDDVRAAVDWALSPKGDLSILADLLVSSTPVWFQLSLMTEYVDKAERALQRIHLMPHFDPVMEMQLQAALGNALWYSADNYVGMEKAFSRALVIAEHVGDQSMQLQALWGLWAFRRGSGEHSLALILATQYSNVAQQAGDPRATTLGHRILGLTYHFLGDQTRARTHWERARSMAPAANLSTNVDFQVDPEIAEVAWLSRVLWLEGFPDQARAMARSAVETAQRNNHAFSICYAIFTGGCKVSLWLGDLEEAIYYNDLMAAQKAGNAYVDMWWRCFARMIRLRTGSERDKLVASFMDPRLDPATLPTIAKFSGMTNIPLPLPLPEVGTADARWNQAELLRIDAEVMLWQGRPDAPAQAEAKLLQALDLARGGGMLSWELRSATSLARLWCRNGRRDEARSVLIAAHARFTEGFETADVKSAAQIIQELS